MKKITSRQNLNFKIWLQCLESKGIQTHRLAILAGKKITADTLKRHPEVITAYLVPENIKENVKNEDFENYLLSEELFEKLDVSGTHHPLVVAKVPEFSVFSPLEEFKGRALYLTFQDPRNMGAILRSADAFGVNNIILGPGAAHPFHPLSLRSASGCVFNHQYFLMKGSLHENFKRQNTVALDMRGQKLEQFKFPKNFILVPGTEGSGVDKNFESTSRVTIPMVGDVESLNVTAATAIALYHLSQNS